MLDLGKEVQDFVRASEHLLSVPSSPLLSDDEGILVEYYIRELCLKYGAPNRDTAGSAELSNSPPLGANSVPKHHDTP